MPEKVIRRKLKDGTVVLLQAIDLGIGFEVFTSFVNATAFEDSSEVDIVQSTEKMGAFEVERLSSF